MDNPPVSGIQIQVYVVLTREGRVDAVKLNRKSAETRKKTLPGSRVEPHLADKAED